MINKQTNKQHDVVGVSWVELTVVVPVVDEGRVFKPFSLYGRINLWCRRLCQLKHQRLNVSLYVSTSNVSTSQLTSQRFNVSATPDIYGLQRTTTFNPMSWTSSMCCKFWRAVSRRVYCQELPNQSTLRTRCRKWRTTSILEGECDGWGHGPLTLVIGGIKCGMEEEAGGWGKRYLKGFVLGLHFAHFNKDIFQCLFVLWVVEVEHR